MKRYFFTAITMLTFACGSKDKDKATSTGSVFDTDINPILNTSCGTSSCHGAGAPNTSAQRIYVDNETNFKADKTRVMDDLESGNMPKAPYKITAAQRQTIADYYE